MSIFFDDIRDIIQRCSVEVCILEDVDLVLHLFDVRLGKVLNSKLTNCNILLWTESRQ